MLIKVTWKNIEARDNYRLRSREKILIILRGKQVAITKLSFMSNS